MINPIKRVSEEDLIYELNRINENTRGILKEIHIADIHFGAIDPKLQFDILKEQFLNKINKIPFDLISIDGDLYDHKCMSNSEILMYASMFISELVEICKRKNATIILIHGTRSHDAEQLKVFYHYLQDPTIDIRIVEQVKFEYVKNAKILCIPELYGMEEDYYNSFLHTTPYDTVFMHGMFKGAVYGADQGMISSDKAPVFTIDDFNLCMGPIISGHVHVASCLQKYFYYTGSPIRCCFGEEQEKGFLIVLHNLDTHRHYVHLEPIKSFRYETVCLDEMLRDDPKNIIDYIENLQSNGIDFIRVDLKKEFNDIEKANLDILKKYYRMNDSVKLKIEDLSVKQQLKVDEDTMEQYNQYSYLFDKSLNEYDILSRYINEIKQYEYISAEELKLLVEEEL